MRLPKFDLSKLRPDLRTRLRATTGQVETAIGQSRERESRSRRHVVAVSHMDEAAFNILAGRWPKLKDLTTRAVEQFPAFAELLQDLYFSLYLPSPRLRSQAELLPTHHGNADLMHQVQSLDLWLYARENSVLNEG